MNKPKLEIIRAYSGLELSMDCENNDKVMCPPHA